MRRSNYDKYPAVAVPDSANAVAVGWDAIGERLAAAVAAARAGGAGSVLTVECYPGVDEALILAELSSRLRPRLVLPSRLAQLSEAKVDQLIAPFLGGGDPVFGFRADLDLPQFFDPAKVARMRAKIARSGGLVLVAGCGARLISPAGLLVYADLARWEAQLRFRRNAAANLGTENHALKAALQYKRAFFVDWRVADRWKRPLLAQLDFVLDTHQPHTPKLADGEAVRRGMRHATTRPFRVVPFFDPAPWGGQWMKTVCELDAAAPNYGWCFDCVPEENSLLLDLGGTRIEIPSINLVFDQPGALLGTAVRARFGDDFPIRFDLLDTMGGGNLSLQVHPLAEYSRRHFGIPYPQDESYYLLDAEAGARVYLGLREGVDLEQMAADLQAARDGGPDFEAERYVCAWPARRHDHFLIPAGTIHCAGAGSMVLEISATPYNFTCKLWDWNRLGLDGQPRPIHLEHGLKNIRGERDAAWTQTHLVNRIELLASGDGWREERTGLHESEFIESRRHWFTKTVAHHTGGGVNVLNLVAGEEAVVESPTNAFRPFPVHYAETFIVPAAVGAYTVRPARDRPTAEYATVKASVRLQSNDHPAEKPSLP